MTNIQIAELNPVALEACELERVVGGFGWKKPVLKKHISLTHISLHKTVIDRSYNTQNAQNFNTVLQEGYGGLNISTNYQQAVNTIG